MTLDDLSDASDTGDPASPRMAGTTPGSMIGRAISHYRILAELGRGGMGIVYRAEDSRLGRAVALKLLPPERTRDGHAKSRFINEARAASRLQHNNICTIHEIDETPDGCLFMAMDLYEGETLEEEMARGPLSLDRLIDVAMQTIDGLSTAHEAGIVHRDVKPGNIMVTAAGVVKILDFGVAKVSGTAGVTRQGAMVGTITYMSPEQLRGETADARSDIWSLGVVLYELSTGVPPFRRDHPAALMHDILHAEPEPPSARRPDLPAELERVIVRCLEKSPGDRYQRAADLRAATRGLSITGNRRDRPSIAVFPFANMGGPAGDDYLCEGLAEEITSALTQIPGLKVIARTSAFVVGRMQLDAREAGRRLDVGSLLEGSVRRAGRRVRVTAQLVSTSDGAHLWSERYDRELTDVLALEDEIATSIAARLRVDLARAEDHPPRPAIDVEAHTSYLEGRYFFARGTPEALAKAKSCYERSIERDPGFALAYDSLAELYWFLGFFGAVPPRDAFSISTWHALRALELDDSLAETHALLGMLRKELDFNWPEVDRELRRAFEINPDSPLVRIRHAISGLLPRGRLDEGMAQIEAVLRTDPLSIFVRWWAAVFAYLARQPERMLDEGRRMIELDASHFLGHWATSLGHQGCGRHQEAVACMQRAHELSGGTPMMRGFLALVLGQAGQRDDVERLLEQAGEIAATGYLPPSVFMLAHAGLGDWDATLDWLERAIEARDPVAVPILTYPFLDPVRARPRYRALLETMHLG